MKKNPLNKGVLTNNAAGIGPVTPEMVHARARELALIDGRDPAHPSPADQQTARRELAGGPEIDRNEALLDAIPEEKRWDPVPGSTGRQAPEAESEDEDEEGRSETEQLVAEGAQEAERDQMRQAATAAADEDKKEK